MSSFANTLNILFGMMRQLGQKLELQNLKKIRYFPYKLQKKGFYWKYTQTGKHLLYFLME